jgi:hypothetical protein
MSVFRSSTLLSRRSLLRSVIGALGGVLAFTSARAQSKMTKVTVAYQDHSADEAKRCDRCILFQPPAACKLVEGEVSAAGTCRIFMKRS